MPENTIPITQRGVFNFMRRSFTGGSTEMYKPNAIGKELYCYDVNSLYPAVMANNLYPTGNIYQFEGDISIIKDKYWIGEAKVESKSDLYQPYLQIHHQTKSGMRTVAPNGSFDMVIHSSEYENALKDYNITITKGYLFESQTDIFSTYVSYMYSLRQKYSKSDPMNLIAKLLLNSLYGRFGMEPQVHSHTFCTPAEFVSLTQKYEILDLISLTKELFFVTYLSVEDKDIDRALPRSKTSGVSVCIASAVRPIKTEFIKKLNPRKINKTVRIGTFDIETVVHNGEHKAYLYCFYDGKNKYSIFANTATELFEKLLVRKYSGFTFYAHNLSRFDIVFLFKDIAALKAKGYKIDFVKKDDKIISIKLSNSQKSITLKDSILLLPMSLAKLSQQFNLDVGKLVEPVYIGPGHEEYKSTDLLHYKKEIDKIEDFNIWKSKVVEYCIQDCVALYEILTNFRNLMLSKFDIDINKYATIPSLAFAIYRMHYMPENTIPITKSGVYKFIRRSFTGGSTEMYKPNAIGKSIYVYDVNSLFPSMMAKNKFPCGNISFFEGDASILNDQYWIAECNVSTKADLYQPYLQVHHKTKGGMRTIAPNGSFNMVMHSSEYYNAIKDYNIEILRGFVFEKSEDIFSRYVNDMYQLRLEYSKTEPMNLIAKLLLNSLYGRFGMQPQLHSHIFVNFSEFTELSKCYEIIDFIQINEDLFFVTYESSDINDLGESLPKNKSAGISVSIASAVTAYARVYMSNFKNNPSFNLYYTDTDSIFVDKELDPIFVNNELGKMKLEYILKDSIFLAPKVYFGLTAEGKKICKVKGFTDPSLLELSDFEYLLNKDSSKSLHHTKWFRNLNLGNITMLGSPYSLVQTDSKRELLFNDEGKSYDSKAIKLIADRKILNK
uniref:DNA polymerase n=1 Tax=Coniophora olivacea TaxID=85977 RepID=A0A896YSL2_9AGAM